MPVVLRYIDLSSATDRTNGSSALSINLGEMMDWHGFSANLFYPTSIVCQTEVQSFSNRSAVFIFAEDTDPTCQDQLEAKSRPPFINSSSGNESIYLAI